MILGAEEMKRIKELQRNEELLYKCIEYLQNLWEINDSTRVEQNFMNIGFSEEDLKRVGISGEEI